MVTNLPTNVDASYPNRSQGDAQHQQHHDIAHTALNDLTAEVETGRLSPDGLNAAIADAAPRVEGLSPRVMRPRAARPTTVSTFQTGHGWTSATWSLNDTTDPAIGSQHLSVTTSTTGNSDADKTITAVDLSGKHLAFLVKVDDITKLDVLTILTGDTGFANYTNWQILKGTTTESGSTIRSGVWTWVYATPAGVGNTVGTGGLSAVTNLRVRAKARTGGQAVTVRVQAIGHFPKPTPFPNGVVTIGFDDCFATQITKAAPKLASLGFKAQAYAIHSVLGSGGFLTEAQLDHLHDRYGWDVSAHAWTQANHNAGYTTLTADVVEEELRQIRAWCIGKGYRGADHFAWPKGESNDSTEAQARLYFATCRAVSTATQFYPMSSPVVGDMPMRMRAHVPAATTTTSVTTTLIDQAYDKGGWLQLGYHDLLDSGAAGSVQYATADFNTVVDYIATKGIPVRTVDEVVAAVNAT